MTHKPKKRRHQSPQQKLAKAREKGAREAVDKAVDVMLVLSVLTLRDKCGADDETMRKFSEGFPYEVDSYNKGYFTLDEAKEMIREEYGDIITMT